MTNPIDYISIRREFVDALSSLSKPAVSVFLALVERNQAQKTLKVGLTFPELMRVADVGKGEAEAALKSLSELTDGIPYITIAPKSKDHVITVNEYWIGETPTSIPFTYRDTDTTKIEKIEKELRRVAIQTVRHNESGLTELLRGEQQEVVRQLEKMKGSALEPIEIWLVSSGISRFGPERFLSTYKRLQSNKNPIRATYAALMNGIKGKGATQVDSTPFKQVHYREE